MDENAEKTPDLRSTDKEENYFKLTINLEFFVANY